MPINIHGKQYVTVAERLKEAGDQLLSLNTEVLYQNPVVIKATVTTKKGVFTGISAANPAKTIEKQSPYEVAETSAVGRALGFAGYGVIDGLATADEMVKAVAYEDEPATANQISVISKYIKDGLIPEENGNKVLQLTKVQASAWIARVQEKQEDL